MGVGHEILNARVDPVPELELGQRLRRGNADERGGDRDFTPVAVWACRYGPPYFEGLLAASMAMATPPDPIKKLRP